MDWQQLVSLAIVLVAATALLWSKLRRRKFSFERRTTCGCGCAGSQSTPPPSTVLRARKGERPQWIIQMK